MLPSGSSQFEQVIWNKVVRILPDVGLTVHDPLLGNWFTLNTRDDTPVAT